MKNLLVILTQSPYANSQSQEGLEVALTAASFGIPTSLLLCDRAISLLNTQQHPEAIGRSPYTKTLKALHYYDIEHIYVCATDLPHDTLKNDLFSTAVTPLNADEMQTFITQHDCCFTF